MIFDPGSRPISRWPRGRAARRSVRLKRGMAGRYSPAAAGIAPGQIAEFRMSLDTATVRRIASLARIRLEEAEVGRMQAELNGILGWIEQLQAVDTDGRRADGRRRAGRAAGHAHARGRGDRWRHRRAGAGQRAGPAWANISACRRWSSRHAPDRLHPARRASTRWPRASISAVELTQAHLDAHRGAQPAAERLPHRHRRAGAGRRPRASDARRGRGPGRAAGRHAAGDQGPVLHRGHADHRGQPHPRQFRPAL